MSASVEAVCIDPEKIELFWPHVEPLLRSAAVKTGLALFSDIEREIFAGRSLVWIAWNGSAIEAAASTSLKNTESGLVCLIVACGGDDMARWLPLLDRIEAYAKEEGCRCVRIIGRKGWERVLSGYESKHVILDKVINGRQ